jgi:hypothetical protein
MDEKDMEEERQNGRRNGWGIERKMLFFLELLKVEHIRLVKDRGVGFSHGL